MTNFLEDDHVNNVKEGHLGLEQHEGE